MTLTDLAEMVHDKTGEAGAELEAITFYCAAVWADLNGNKAIGDYFDRRCKQAASRSRFGPAQQRLNEAR